MTVLACDHRVVANHRTDTRLEAISLPVCAEDFELCVALAPHWQRSNWKERKRASSPGDVSEGLESRIPIFSRWKRVKGASSPISSLKGFFITHWNLG